MPVTAEATKPCDPPLERVSAIDALRGLAALVVLMAHARSMLWVGVSETYRQHGWQPDLNAWLGYLSAPLGLGGRGVTLFFVLSGYCIHRRSAQLLAANPGARLNSMVFFVRRFWRIYPTYFAALLVTALIDGWLAGWTGSSPPGQDNSLYAFLISCVSLQGYLAPHFGSNGVFWTLAMEVHLYAAYPLLFVLSRRWGPQGALLCTLFAGMGYVVVDALTGLERRLPHRFEIGPVFLPYWFTWTIGFFLAEVEAGRAADWGDRRWRLLGTGGLAAGLALTVTGHHYVAEVGWALFFAALLRWSLVPEGRRFWNRRFGLGLALVGFFSYSLYAIHAPLLRVFQSLLAPTHPQKFATLWPALGGVACVIPVAWLFFRMVEWWSIKKSARQR